MALFIDSTEILPTYDIVIGGTHLKQIDVVKGSNPPVTVWRKNAWIIHIPEGLTKTLRLYKNGTLLDTVTTAGDYAYETADNDNLSITVDNASCWSGTASGAVEITASYDTVTWSLTAPTVGEFRRVGSDVYVDITAKGRSTKALPYSYNYVIDAEKSLEGFGLVHTGVYISGNFGSSIPQSNTYVTLGTVIYNSSSPFGSPYDNSHFTSVTIPHMGVYSGFIHSTYTKTDDQYIEFN